MHKILIILILLCSTVFSQELDNSSSTKQIDTDSSQSTAASLTTEDKITELEKENKRLAKQIAELERRELLKAKLKKLEEENPKSIEENSDEELDIIDNEFEEDDDEFISEETYKTLQKKLHSVNNQGYGGAGGFALGQNYVNIGYINDFLSKENGIAGSPAYGANLQLPLSSGGYSSMYMSGGFGFGGIGNGVRIGGAGYGANRIYDLYDDSTNYKANVSVGYGGVIIQKGIVHDRHNIVIESLIGAGGIDFRLAKGDNGDYTGTSNSSFSKDLSSNSGDTQWEDEIEGMDEESVTTAFFAMELSVAYSYSVFSWLHPGLQVGTSLMKSIEYENSLGSFTTFNPFFRVKFTFGNLG